MSKETSEDIASLAARVLNEQPREGDEHLSFNALLVQAKRLAGSCLSQTEGETISVPTPVNWEHVANAMVGCVEGGSTYWLNAFHAALDDNSRTLKRAISLAGDGIWYAEASYWRDGGRAKVRYDNPDKGPSEAEREIGKPEIILGLRTMAEKAPRHFSDLINENDDATTHDVMIQCILFGDIVYG